MTPKEIRAELIESEVYLVTLDDRTSVVAEYAGMDERGRLVLVAGPLAPLHVPAGKVLEWEKLT